jgi:DNA primase
MGKIPEHIIEEIRSKISITDVISQYVSLTPRGGRLWGLCPFHNEKTPSFTVNEEKGFYHCFGCGKGGSAFNFLMEIENLNFVEAASRLAEQAGIVIQEETPLDRERRSDREALFELYRKLSDSFHYILEHKPMAETAREYLRARNISQKMIEAYRIGYAPDNPDWLFKFLRSKNYSEGLLASSGMFSKNNPRYPLFRNRILFPIFDKRGRITGFGGRALNNEQNAKYLNTPETAIFSKREQLFGLSQALDAVRGSQELIICEGYFDVIALAQCGIQNAAAPLGTAFTEQQALLIRRYTPACTLFFDNDQAGHEAAVKTIIILEKAGLSSNVVENTRNYDPADYLQHETPELLRETVKKRINGFNYLVKKAVNKYDIALPDGKLSVFNEVKPYIEIIESEIKKQSAIKLLSDYLDINEAVINRELQNHVREKNSYPARKADRNSNTSWSENGMGVGVGGNFGDALPLKPAKLTTDLYLMLTLVNNRKYFQTVRQSISIEQIQDVFAVDIYTALEESLREGETSFEYLVERLEFQESRNAAVGSYGMDEFSDDEEAQKIIRDAVRTINLRDLISRQKFIEQQIRASSIQGINEIQLKDLLYEKKFIDEEIKKLRKS